MTKDTSVRRETNPLPTEILGTWRLLMGVSHARQQVGLEVQRQRLVRSMVTNDLKRKGIS